MSRQYLSCGGANTVSIPHPHKVRGGLRRVTALLAWAERQVKISPLIAKRASPEC
jgi:hypothetical protein